MSHLVCIASYYDLPSAYIAKSKLEGSDIHCFLDNEFLVGIQWLYCNAVGGVKLWVNANDAELALELLNENQTLPAKQETNPATPKSVYLSNRNEIATSMTDIRDMADTKDTRGNIGCGYSGDPAELDAFDVFCPKCNSSQVDSYHVGKAFAAASFLLGFPLPFLRKRYKCQNCDQRWK